MSSLSYVNIDQCTTGRSHPIWCNSTDPLIIYRATIHAKLLVQRYPIYSCHVSNSSTRLCPCCKSTEESLEHFLLDCPNLKTARHPHLQHIITVLQENNMNTEQLSLVKIILDPSTIFGNTETTNSLISIARTLCFNLHLQRTNYISRTKQKTTSTSSSSIKVIRNILNYRATGCVPQRTATKE